MRQGNILDRLQRAGANLAVQSAVEADQIVEMPKATCPHRLPQGRVKFRPLTGQLDCVGESGLRVLARSSFQNARPVQGYPASSVRRGLD